MYEYVRARERKLFTYYMRKYLYLRDNTYLSDYTIDVGYICSLKLYVCTLFTAVRGLRKSIVRNY